MTLLTRPIHLMLIVLSEWVRKEQQKAIEYLQAENEVLREKLGDGRILLNDNQRRRLAVTGKALGRRTLQEYSRIAKADTILGWHRKLIGTNRYTNTASNRVGRPSTLQEIVDLVLRMADQNKGWGYTRIQGALSNLGYRVGRGTVANILKTHGIEPAPIRQRQTTWTEFWNAHREVFRLDYTSLSTAVLQWLVSFFHASSKSKRSDRAGSRNPGSLEATWSVAPHSHTEFKVNTNVSCGPIVLLFARPPPIESPPFFRPTHKSRARAA